MLFNIVFPFCIVILKGNTISYHDNYGNDTNSTQLLMNMFTTSYVSPNVLRFGQKNLKFQLKSLT